MTIATQSRTAGPFECNGSTTVYPFTFKVFTASDVSVIFRNTASGNEAKLVLNVDYTVALNSNQNANPGGSITINGPAYESGNTLTLTSELQYLQPTDLTNNGGFYPKVISDALDRLTIFAQQIRGLATRSLKFPISDGNLDATVPGKDQRKGRVLAFDAVTGLPMPGPLVEGIGVGINYVGETAPVVAFEGMRWYNPLLPATFVYYVDEDSAQWVEEAHEGALSQRVVVTHQDVSTMAADTNLTAGMQVKTLVNNQISKKGGSIYFIKTNAQATADGDIIDGELVNGILTGANFQLPNSLCAILDEDKYKVTIEQLGGGVLVNRNDAAREKAWNYCGVCRLGKGIYKFEPFAIRSGVAITSPGVAYTTVKIMSAVGNDIGLRVSSSGYGLAPGAPLDYWSLYGFQLEDLNSKIPLYVVHNRFFTLDQVYVVGGIVASAFIAYNFVGRIGLLRADSSVNNGIEFGHDRFGWGVELISNNVVNVDKLWAYGNGTGLTVRPALSEINNAGAGLVLGTGLSNDFRQAYAEGNKGIGIITTGAHGYTINSCYVEANDQLVSIPANQVEFYNNAQGCSLGDVTYLFGAPGSLYSETALTIQSYRGTRITGPGRVSVYGYYRDAEIETPATVSVTLFNVIGARNDVLGVNPTPINFYMSGDFDPFVSTQFSRNGVYSAAPRVVFQDAGSLGSGLELSIFEDGVIKYYHATAGGGAFGAGAFVDFPVLNFTWDKTKIYRMQLSGASTYTGRAQFSINAKIMV